MSEAMEAPTRESTGLVAVTALVPAVVFAPGGADDLLTKLEAEVRAVKTDISTKAGREAVASLAYKVARSKTALDEMGKDLTADLKARTTAVDAERRVIRERLDSLRDEVRKPLTDWENAEKDRVAAHEAALADLTRTASFAVLEPSIEEIDGRLTFAKELSARDWQEFSQRAYDEGTKATDFLTALRARTIEREAERVELERRRKEEAEAKERERLAEVARQAADKARREAEEKAAAEAKATEQRATAERERIERERQAAEERAAKAEREKKAAEEKAAQEKKLAAERAEKDRQAAVEAERKRVAEEKARTEAEAAKREANKRHSAKINGEVLTALVAVGLTTEQAKAVVIALALRKIPHTTIEY